MTLRMPAMGPLMTEGQVHKAYVGLGQHFSAKTRLFDVRVDLSAGASDHCPPVFHFVIVALEPGWIRECNASVGDFFDVAQTMLVATTTAEEALSTPSDRDLRVAIAAIHVDLLFG
jgi:hypothetical protein